MAENTRPSRADPAVREAAVKALAEQCAGWSSDIDAAEWVDALRRVSLHDNGFEIARDLDRYGRIWGIDAELVEILDGASMRLWDAHTAAVKAWVAETGIQPTFAVGDRIASPHRDCGTISGFVADQGVYLFVPDGEREKFSRGGGVHVPYEDASPTPFAREVGAV